MCVVGVVGAGDRVEAEIRRGTLVAGVGRDHRKTFVQGENGRGLWTDRGADHAVVAAAALVQEAPVPLGRQAHFKADVVGLAILPQTLVHATSHQTVRAEHGARGGARWPHAVCRDQLGR